VEVTPGQLIALLRNGTAPLTVRTAIARGTLPLPAATLVEALDIVADDPEAAVATAAADSLDRLPPSVVRAVAGAPATPPALLERIVARFADNEAIALEVARNPAAPDAAFAAAAALPYPEVLAVVGRNRDRLERCPEAVAALLANPQTPTEVVALWQEAEERRPAAPAAAAAEPGAAEPPAAAFDEVLVEEDEGEGDHSLPAGGEEGALTARQLSIYSMLKKMSMGQKVALAVKGNKEVRGILIRANNKLLCLKVLENPRLGDNEVEAYAKSTNVSEDVLRGISQRKEWLKRPAIVRALVFNPRTPLGVSLDFLKWLSLRELEQLAKNRNVPETLRAAGRKLHQLKRGRKG